jgi:hypothetical protein
MRRRRSTRFRRFPTTFAPVDDPIELIELIRGLFPPPHYAPPPYRPRR